MQIFNLEIFGSDKEEWLAMPKSQKKEWILKYTNQTNDVLIEEFLANPKITKDVHCLDCRNKKEKITISEIVESKVTAPIVKKSKRK